MSTTAPLRTVLAADLGGTKCRFGRVDADLQVRAVREVPTTMVRADFDAAMHEAFDAVSAPLDGCLPAEAIGVGVAAVVLADGDTLTGSPNLPLAEVPLASELRARYGLPVTLLNDGRASAFGEYLTGEAAGRDPMLVLFFGTGIGIGLIIGGAPYAGAGNAAGEVGHAIFRPDGRQCVCRRYGCFEAYCGGGPMTSRAAAELGACADGTRWTVGRIVARAEAGDAAAAAILGDAELAAGTMVASLCTVLNPAVVVLGGGVLKGWPELAPRIERAARSWCTDNVNQSMTFLPSTGGSDAILRGVARATGVC